MISRLYEKTEDAVLKKHSRNHEKNRKKRKDLRMTSMTRLNLILNHLFSLDKFLRKVERDMAADAESSKAFKGSGEPKGGTLHDEAPS